MKGENKMKSVFDGYLTDGCATCEDWADGSDDRGLGCACHFPIMECPHFAKMTKKEEAKMRICKNCYEYNKDKKICLISSKHTARKNTCNSFIWRGI